MVTSFRYLGRVILAADYYCLALVRNYSRARAFWERITRILIRKRAEPRLSDFFFKAMVQVLLIFSAETWVFTPVWSGSWGGVQDQVVRRLTGWVPLQKTDRKWYYTLAEM